MEGTCDVGFDGVFRAPTAQKADQRPMFLSPQEKLLLNYIQNYVARMDDGVGRGGVNVSVSPAGASSVVICMRFASRAEMECTFYIHDRPWISR